MYMKRVSLFLMFFLLCSCSRIGTESNEQDYEETKNYVVSCSLESNEQYMFFSQDDEIQSMQEVFYMSYEDAGVTYDMDPETVKENINDKLSNKYSQIAGVTVIVDEIVDYNIKIIVMIDFRVADMNQLIEQGLINEGNVQNQYISLEQTMEAYSSNGFACSYQ